MNLLTAFLSNVFIIGTFLTIMYLKCLAMAINILNNLKNH